MKKFLVLTFICLFTLSSCTYTPVNDFYKIRNKTSLKDISTLNNPVIFAKTPVQGFSHGKKVEYVDFGVVYCIYDWKNNEIFDYVFSKDYKSYYEDLQFIGIKKSDNSRTYLDLNSAKELVKINSFEGQVKTQKLPSNEHYYHQWVKPSADYSEYAVLLYTEGFNTETLLQNCKFYIFEEGSEQCTTIEYSDVKSIYDMNPIMNTEGDTVWFTDEQVGADYKDTQIYIKSIDLKNKQINDPVISFNSYSGNYDENSTWQIENKYGYSVMFADTDYLILKKAIYNEDDSTVKNSIVVVNLLNKETKETNLNDHLYIRYIAFLDNKYYVFTQNRYADYFIYTINPVTGGLTEICEIPMTAYFDSYFIRDNSIYFINDEKNKAYISRFNAESNSYEELLTVKLNELSSK